MDWIRTFATSIVLIVALPSYVGAGFSRPVQRGPVDTGRLTPAPTYEQQEGNPSQQGQQHDHKPEEAATTADLPPFIPRLTDEDRQAAFPDVDGHATHDKAFHSFVLVDQL